MKASASSSPPAVAGLAAPRGLTSAPRGRRVAGEVGHELGVPVDPLPRVDEGLVLILELVLRLGLELGLHLVLELELGLVLALLLALTEEPADAAGDAAEGAQERLVLELVLEFTLVLVLGLELEFLLALQFGFELALDGGVAVVHSGRHGGSPGRQGWRGIGTGQRRLRPTALVGRPAGVAPRGTRTSLTTRTVRAGRPPLGGTRTGVTTRTNPGRGRGTWRAVVVIVRVGCLRSS